ncbi:MAG: DUF3305 domain-containing protein [Burkholderiaceae bacterium]|nr:DUF3305 domain-containing protein [Burkholderiaceae bacterium]
MTDREYRPPEGAEPLLEIDPVAVRVRFECRETGHWLQPRIWRPVAVEPAASDSDLAVHLYLDECEGYYLNLTTAEPSLFVQWRLHEDDTGIVVDDDPVPPRALAVTASYNEAGRWMDGGARVDRVPMPEPMVSWVAEYVSLHYVAEPTKKKRKAGKPSFLARDQFGQMTEREREMSRERDTNEDA